FFSFNATAPTEIYTLSLHDALPIFGAPVFLAILTTVCGLLPFVVPILWASIGFWLIATGHTAAGVGLLIWGTLVVSWIDNIVRRSEEHTSELQSRENLVCRLLLEKK